MVPAVSGNIKLLLAFYHNLGLVYTLHLFFLPMLDSRRTEVTNRYSTGLVKRCSLGSEGCSQSQSRHGGQNVPKVPAIKTMMDNYLVKNIVGDGHFLPVQNEMALNEKSHLAPRQGIGANFHN